VARQYYHTLLIGGPVLLTSDQMAETAKKLAGYGIQLEAEQPLS
jgi:L-fuculose-phosphate aldolase